MLEPPAVVNLQDASVRPWWWATSPTPPLDAPLLQILVVAASPALGPSVGESELWWLGVSQEAIADALVLNLANGHGKVV